MAFALFRPGIVTSPDFFHSLLRPLAPPENSKPTTKSRDRVPPSAVLHKLGSDRLVAVVRVSIKPES